MSTFFCTRPILTDANAFTVFGTLQDWLIIELARVVEQLSSQIRFIIDVNEDKLKLRNRKKADVLKDLKTRGYKLFPPKEKQSKGAAIPANDSEEETENDSADASGYDYLLRMSIWHLTYEKVWRFLCVNAFVTCDIRLCSRKTHIQINVKAEVLKKQRDAKQRELDLLKAKATKEIWIEDLDAFVEKWQVCSLYPLISQCIMHLSVLSK